MIPIELCSWLGLGIFVELVQVIARILVVKMIRAGFNLLFLSWFCRGREIMPARRDTLASY